MIRPVDVLKCIGILIAAYAAAWVMMYVGIILVLVFPFLLIAEWLWRTFSKPKPMFDSVAAWRRFDAQRSRQDDGDAR